MANIFPKWVNYVPVKVIIALLIITSTIIIGITYYFSPQYHRVGYAPTQPVSFSHEFHSGTLAIDCRYCHTYVDRSSHSNVPGASVCMSCHSMVLKDDERLSLVRESYNDDKPIPWVRIHKLPDYVYFNHAVHVNRGVSCVECHGKVNEMEVVYHAKELSMGWCLECHRNPEEFIRPIDKVYDLDWERPDNIEGEKDLIALVHDWGVNPPQSCSGCHR